MLRTGSPEEMIEFYREAFGFELREKKEMDTFTLYFLRSDDQTAELELTYNHGEDSEYEKGEGFGHIGFSPGSRPKTSRSPESLPIWPVKICIKVDLPAPLGPKTPTISPVSTSRSTSESSKSG
ncbi:glyoxalase/bleomycin resistance protein/dioxygenase [Candidatus Haloredivivus sp. G17]|nr:glyoxalase/bleomycin resistance protein/dioxygenase [Candidatus Haloredivivus sp. G17]